MNIFGSRRTDVVPCVAGSRPRTLSSLSRMATVVAVFNQIPSIQGHAVATLEHGKTRLRATFTQLPKGKHGFHIHRAGDLRGEGCQGACEHFHVGPLQDHGSKPGSKGQRQRHTGDLGNIEQTGSGPCKYSYLIPDITPEDLLGRALIIHEDEDDLGLGDFPDSKTTGHSGKRIGCAIFGRATRETCSHQVIRPRPKAEGSPVYKTGLIKTRRKTRH